MLTSLPNTAGNKSYSVGVSDSVQLVIELYASNQSSVGQISLSPGQAFRSQWIRDRNGTLGLRVWDHAGNILAQTGELP